MVEKTWATYKGLYDTLDEFRTRLNYAIKKTANNLDECEWTYAIVKTNGKILYLNAPVKDRSLDNLFDKYSNEYNVSFMHKFRWGKFWEAGRLIIKTYRKLITQKGPG